jgi:hypothetical protein
MEDNGNFLRRGNLEGNAPEEPSLTPEQRAAEAFASKKAWEAKYKGPNLRVGDPSKAAKTGTATGNFSKEGYTGTLPASSASFPRNLSLYGAPTLKGSGKRSNRSTKAKNAKKTMKTKKTMKRRV